MRICIFDCDGVLVSSLARYRTIKHPTKGECIDLQYWRDNTHKALEVDTLLPHAEMYKKLLQDKETFVIIATARQMVVGDAEYTHIMQVLGKPDALIYRKLGDERGGAELKIKGIRKLLNLKQFRNATIEVWEDNFSYLEKLCKEFKCLGHYVPSQQGH